ncbi:MAG TPA: iron-containing alcohol dehydrogenase [Gammaproteobacteria bacterium]|nr:iron-containing alcohol dehydrogenase [Gammaproteobacteria bacterium]
MMPSFSIGRLPRIEFGRGCLGRLPALMADCGRRALIVTGARSFTASPAWEGLRQELETSGLEWALLPVAGEPSPALVDEAVARHRDDHIDVVVGIGGGSALDAAKAIAGLLRTGRSVMDHLEGVGPELPYEGPAVPFIAVPTTAGTGSEATRNAVLSIQGQEGFKKSFRDERLVARWALVDPALLAGCPPPVIAANGMDALTQLLESYTSLRAGAFTDALAESGLRRVREGLLTWHREGADAVAAQDAMAWAALASGITLAHCGLGAVHGLASPLGAFHPIPHGVACGTLVAAVTEVNIAALQARAPDSPALDRYARAAELLHGRSFPDRKAAWAALVQRLNDWTERLELPRLSAYGVTEAALPAIVAHCRGSSMKTNPVVLSDEEIHGLLLRRL